MELLVLFLNLKLFMNRNRKGEVIRTEVSAFLPMELDQTADCDITDHPHRFT